MTLKNNDTQSNQTPVLADVSIEPSNREPIALCADQDVCTSTGLCTGEADIDAGSFDPDGDPLTLVSTPASPYPLGDTAVALSVSDGTAAPVTCGATVTVRDCEPPAIACVGAQTVECTGDGAAPAVVSASATDNCDAVAATCAPPSGSFRLGTTPVVCASTDDAGNTASCTTSVTVQDTTPPVVSGALNAGVLWPPNHKHRRVNLADCGITVMDACMGPMNLAQAGAAITCVTSDEPPDSTGDGSTPADIVIVGATAVDLLAERKGNGDGRVYRIGFTVGDGQGNPMSATCTVGVPHSQNGGAPVDSGVQYTVCR